jgi:hypothetical protein
MIKTGRIVLSSQAAGAAAPQNLPAITLIFGPNFDPIVIFLALAIRPILG